METLAPITKKEMGAVMLNMTAANLRAVLCFINPKNTPKIAYDEDEMATPLIDKLTNAVRDADGSQSVTLWFNHDEGELYRQFAGVCSIISECMATFVDTYKSSIE